MKLTLALQSRTRATEEYLIEYNSELINVTVKRHPKRRGIDNLRHAICKTLKLNSSEFRFIGNRRINGQWVTEWIVL